MSIKIFFFVCYNPVELVNERFIGIRARQPKGSFLGQMVIPGSLSISPHCGQNPRISEA